MKINLKKVVTSSGIMLATGLMFASAHMGGMGSEMDNLKLTAKFEQHAKILGVNVSEVKNAWAEGKSIFDLAKEKGISTSTLQAKMQESRLAEMTIKINSLVTAGTITQAQADKKIATMKTLEAKMNGVIGGKEKGKKGMRGGEKMMGNKVNN
jgi:hypothetical protein